MPATTMPRTPQNSRFVATVFAREKVASLEDSTCVSRVCSAMVYTHTPKDPITVNNAMVQAALFTALRIPARLSMSAVYHRMQMARDKGKEQKPATMKKYRRPEPGRWFGSKAKLVVTPLSNRWRIVGVDMPLRSKISMERSTPSVSVPISSMILCLSSGSVACALATPAYCLRSFSAAACADHCVQPLRSASWESTNPLTHS
mmetsp:Transcript_70959/g.207950  ORF Transcript_70959/g.207950 Transcript_70959/m.207950 type:complete len:203 (-) Transcript_70959:111-719(-)